MTPERFRQIRNLFEAVVERPADTRDTFFAEACVGDSDLQAEVERLLAAHRRDTDLLAGPSRRPLRDPARDRPRRNGDGLLGRARRPRFPQTSGAQDRAPGGRQRGGAAAFSAGTRDAGHFGPPQYRAPAGRRRRALSAWANCCVGETSNRTSGLRRSPDGASPAPLS
jgi:hypothetical protein